MSALAGRTALVTGGAQGLGAGIAETLAGAGATVLVTDIDADGAAAVAERIGGHAFPLDVTSEEGWIAAIAVARTKLGGLNVLVNNAGIATLGSVEDISLADWRRCMAVNADGAFLGCKHALPLMRESQPGSIVNISSIAGIVAGHNLAAYNASKAAIWMLSKSVALHCAKQGWNIRSNSVHPSFIDTAILDGFVGGRSRDETLGYLARQIPNGRVGVVDDVAQAVLYLASDASAMMTGAELKLDGGLSAM